MADNKVMHRGSIYSKGYGQIYKLIMVDKNISYKAKAIYAYICSYAGNGLSAFPSVSLMRDHLGMGKDTFYNAMNELKQFGYITIEKQKDEQGMFATNLYIIEIDPCPYNPDTAERDTDKPPTGARDTNNNSSNINSFNNNRSKRTNKNLLSGRKKADKPASGEDKFSLLNWGEFGQKERYGLTPIL